MNNKKTTKRALLSSVMAIVLCLAMLIGTTFAWFTDSASTAVNKIQAGTLDVQLLDENGNSLEGQTLAWQKAAGHESDEVLWEPGCTYKLQSFKIKNNGNLALKYKIAISGIDGDAELNEVIDWSYTLADGTAFPITDEGHLTAGQETGLITISGQMQESAGNKYQGKSIDGIGITVVATQDTVEFDSIDNQYDKDALYPILAPVLNNTDSIGFASIPATETKIENDKAVSTIPASTEIYENTSDNTPITPASGGELQRVLKTTNSSADSVTYDIGYNYVNGSSTTEVHKFSKVVENIIQLSTGLKEVKVTHNGTAMTEATTKADGTYHYDAATGKLYVYSSTYSSYTISYKSEFVLAVDGQGYSFASFSASVAAGASYAGKTVTLLDDITVTNEDLLDCEDCYWQDPIEALIPYLGENVTFDGADNTIRVNFNDGYVFCSVDGATIKNLTVDYNATDASMIYDSFDATIEKVTTKGTLKWNSGNNAAFVTYPFADLTMTECINEAKLSTSTGDTSFYNSVFCGYALGTGTFKMTDCVNNGTLTCGKASMFLGNWSYGTRVDFVISSCKNNGVIRSTSNEYYGGAGKYNYCTSDYWDKAHCLTFTFDDNIKYTSSTAIKWYDVNAQGSIVGIGKFEFGPFDKTLAVTMNADKTLTITPATVDVDSYVVSVGTYYGLPNGSCRTYVTETVTGTTTTLKAFGFVSQKWVVDHPNAVSRTLNGFTTYTLDGETYYLISDKNATDTSPRGPEMISVSAFKGGTLVASAQLNIQ